MTKKIIILLLGLVLGSNAYSVNKLSTTEVVAGTITKYLLYFQAACFGFGSLDMLCKSVSLSNTAGELEKAGIPFSWFSDTVFNESGKHAVVGMVLAVLCCGTYKAARVMNYGLEKNSEIRPQERNA